MKNDYLKIINEPYMPLIAEKIGSEVTTPLGLGDLYSLCHYSKRNGDLMQDPEMCFVVVHNVVEQGTLQTCIFPYMYQQAYLGMYQESAAIANNTLTVTDEKMQAQHTNFGNLWLPNIRSQGFLKQI